MSNEASSLVVPLWPAVVAALSVIGSAIGGTIWVMQTFQTKHDAARDRESLQSLIEEGDSEVKDREQGFEKRVAKMEDLVGKVAQDVSFIRGRLERGHKP
jgi:hypothetical protein